MTLLNDRFEVLEEIGRGSQAVTHRALDHETGEIVAIKELDFRRVEDWKAQELFEREGATLRSLNHPSIPSYIDAFAVELDETVQLFLVQEFIDGETLQDELDRGMRWSEADAISDAVELLDALDYLHNLAPPVVHRDIKPSNIIRRADGRLALVDFGAVQNIVQRTVGGSTIVGTPGYMPIEQVMGRAVPATDLYAVGATLIHLLSRTDPSQLPVVRNRLQFRDRVPSLSDGFSAALERLTEPTAEDRFESADAAKRAIQKDARVVVAPTDQPLDRLPSWATTSTDGDTHFTGLAVRDTDGDLLRVAIHDSADSVGLMVRRTSVRSLTPGVTGAMAVIGTMLIFGGPPAWATVLAFVAMFLAWRAARSRRWRRGLSVPHHLSLDIDERHYILDLDGSRVRGEVGDIADIRYVDSALVLRTVDGRDVRLMSIVQRDRAEWIAAHLNLRLAQLKSGDTVFESEDERVEFWKEEPAKAR